MREARDSAAIRFRRYWLAIWFGGLACALVLVRDPDSLWFDARLYVAATKAWLQGADPWLVTLGGNGFGAPPPTLLVLAPFAILPFGLPLLILTCFVGAAATIRVLRLPWWWVLFPPLVECVLSANIQAWLIPLLFLRAGPLAVFAKIYAAAPLVLLGRWRQLAVTGALLALTLPILPWTTFVADLAGHHRVLPRPDTLRAANGDTADLAAFRTSGSRRHWPMECGVDGGSRSRSPAVVLHDARHADTIVDRRLSDLHPNTGIWVARALRSCRG